MAVFGKADAEGAKAVFSFRSVEWKEWASANRHVVAGLAGIAVFGALTLRSAMMMGGSDPEPVPEPEIRLPSSFGSLTGDRPFEDHANVISREQRELDQRLSLLERQLAEERRLRKNESAERERLREEVRATKEAARKSKPAPAVRLDGGANDLTTALVQQFATLEGDQARGRAAQDGALSGRDRLQAALNAAGPPGGVVRPAAARTVEPPPAPRPSIEPAAPPAPDERFSGGITLLSETRPVVEPVAIEDEDPFYLPAGSFARGVMLYGVDAPTDGGYERAPAVLIKAVDGFTGPNSASIPLEGCMFVGSAAGNFGTSRADIKVVSISCTFAGRSFEKPMVGVIVGPDNRNGLPGELNDHLFEKLGWATVAGVGEGAAEAFQASSTTQIVSGSTGSSTTFVDPGDAAAYAAGGAAAGAARQLGDVAFERVRRLAPSVKVDGGDLVWIVVLSGVTLEGLEDHLGTVQLAHGG